jgi:inner membrane protein
LGEAGLKQKSGLGLATLVLAANLPDIDVLGSLVGENLAWRRGWTHGPLAMLTLPILLTLAMIVFDRWQERRGTRPTARAPVRAGWLLALAFLGTLSHPLLDFLNNYGVRLLMPFSERWFYGDTLFIIDVWVWAVLGVGVYLARRRRRLEKSQAGRPALSALAAVAVYVSGMGAASVAAERFVKQQLTATGSFTPTVVVANPVLLDPFRRSMVFGTSTSYGFGELRWSTRPHLAISPSVVAANMTDPAIAKAAAQHKEVADFLYWSRLPFAKVERRDGVARVRIGDARYSHTPTGRFSVSAVVRE